jgi:hypothetical protein
MLGGGREALNSGLNLDQVSKVLLDDHFGKLNGRKFAIVRRGDLLVSVPESSKLAVDAVFKSQRTPHCCTPIHATSEDLLHSVAGKLLTLRVEL